MDPEQISGWLKGGNERRLRAVEFAKTIYAFIYRASPKGRASCGVISRVIVTNAAILDNGCDIVDDSHLDHGCLFGRPEFPAQIPAHLLAQCLVHVIVKIGVVDVEGRVLGMLGTRVKP